MTRLGAAIGLAYGLAVIAVFLSVVALWPTSSVPSPSAVAIATSTASPTPSSTSTPEPTKPSTPRSSQRPPPTDPKPTKAPTPPPTEPPIFAIRGEATFYCLLPSSPCTTGFLETGLYAAAGAELRAALGDWRGQKVTVWRGTRHVTVTLVDTCSCDIDLYAVAFIRLAPLSLGVLDVEIRW